MDENAQQVFDFTPLPTFLVGCRVGVAIQHFHVEAVEHRQARKFVAEGVPDATVILVRVK